MEEETIIEQYVSNALVKPFKRIHPQKYYDHKFHIAIITSRTIIVEMFLARKMVSVGCIGLAIENDVIERTAIHNACCIGHTTIIKMLLKYGANANDVDKMGSNSLHHLCSADGSSVLADNIRMLCKHIDNINARNNDGHTAFYYLCNKHTRYAAKVLAALGCIIEYERKRVRLFIRSLSQQDILFFIFHIWKQSCTNTTKLYASQIYRQFSHYFDELQKLYNQPIYNGNRTTYFQFLNLSTWERAKYLNDEIICVKLENVQYIQREFPFYSSRIIQCYQNAKKIKKLKAEFYLICQDKIHNKLHEEILEHIIEMLDETDLETFVKAFEHVPKIK